MKRLALLLFVACSGPAQEPPMPYGYGHFRRGDLRHPTCFEMRGKTYCVMPCKMEDDCPTSQTCSALGGRCVARSATR